MKKTVLMTGANGVIGTLLHRELEKAYTLRLLALQPIAETETIIADVGDLPALLQACKGVDSIIHLAARTSTRSPWADVLHSNIVGTYNVFEAARQCGVKQVIYASTNHTVGMYESDTAPEIYQTGLPFLDHRIPVRPDSLYGVSKCFGETLGQYYADVHGLKVICLRIGFVHPQDTPYPAVVAESRWRLAALWLSHRDTVQLFERSLRAEEVSFALVYGISNNQPHFYDLEHARDVLGYVPQDGVQVALAQQEQHRP